MRRLSVQRLCARIVQSRRGWGLGTWVLVTLGAAALSGQSSQPIKDQPLTPSPAPIERDPQPAILDNNTFNKMRRLPANLIPTLESEPYHLASHLLGDSFVEYEATRWVVLSDANAQWTRQQAALLQRAHHQFLRYTRRLGLQPRPIRHKLVCVLFENRDEYRKFAQEHDGVTAEWISGYYSPKHDRVVFYNVSTNPPRQVSSTQDRPGATPSPRDIADDQATGTTVHEAIHQLMFHTGVQTPHIEYPLWICEGLATAFETDDPDSAFGPDHEYAPRRERFEQLLEADQLIELRKLVTYARMPDDSDETVQAVYHQSYALVTWMSRFRRDELRAYLQLMLAEVPGRPTPQRQLELFEQAFGDVDQLERTWLRHERRNLEQRED